MWLKRFWTAGFKSGCRIGHRAWRSFLTSDKIHLSQTSMHCFFFFVCRRVPLGEPEIMSRWVASWYLLAYMKWSTLAVSSGHRKTMSLASILTEDSNFIIIVDDTLQIAAEVHYWWSVVLNGCRISQYNLKENHLNNI